MMVGKQDEAISWQNSCNLHHRGLPRKIVVNASTFVGDTAAAMAFMTRRGHQRKVHLGHVFTFNARLAHGQHPTFSPFTDLVSACPLNALQCFAPC